MRSNYFLIKLVSATLVLFIVISATFILLRTLPGGPFDSEKKLPPKVKANIEKKIQTRSTNPEPIYILCGEYN